MLEKERGLGTLLVIILLTQKLVPIVLWLKGSVKDAARRFAVASAILDSPFQPRATRSMKAPVKAGQGQKRSDP